MIGGFELFACSRCDAKYRTLESLTAHMAVCTAQPLRAPVICGGAYSELRRVLDLAFEQAASGKGKERHAVEGERFEDQRIVQLGAWMGSHHFEAGQACKKLLESARLKPGAGMREVLGAINYAAAAYLLLEQEDARTMLAGPQQGEG